MTLLELPMSNAPRATDDTQGSRWEAVFVHGFGGQTENPPFVSNARSFLAKNFGRDEAPLNVRTHAWDSVELPWWECREQSLCQKWKEAKEKAEIEAKVLKEREVDALERRGQPYVLIGFSLGAYVIARSLEHCWEKLRHLRGIIFLGAAVPRSYRPDASILPDGLRILNYHSLIYDHVLKDAYQGVETEEQAGGRVGFGDPRLFDDRQVGCTHVRKWWGLGVFHFDYSEMADPLMYLLLWRQGIQLGEGEPVKHCGWWPMTRWESWWNEVAFFERATIDGESGPVLIQWNKLWGHFRAGTRTDNGAWRPRLFARNLHLLLKAIGV